MWTIICIIIIGFVKVYIYNIIATLETSRNSPGKIVANVFPADLPTEPLESLHLPRIHQDQ
jgi:heme/copper-type cytochrome/quinol oxidase subunit 2